jgi:uncharacterized protein YuzB (UPF0349 family)
MRYTVTVLRKKRDKSQLLDYGCLTTRLELPTLAKFALVNQMAVRVSID